MLVFSVLKNTSYLVNITGLTRKNIIRKDQRSSKGPVLSDAGNLLTGVVVRAEV